MKYLSIIILLVLASCTSQTDREESKNGQLNSERVMQTYTEENRGINLENSDLSDFVNLNGLNGEEEIANINISNNSIDVLDVSEYNDLLRLIAANNNFRFFGDIKLPAGVKHLVLNGNNLENLDGIENLTELVTLDISNNNLDEEDLKKLSDLTNLKFVAIEGNNVSEEMIANMNAFSSRYLQDNKTEDIIR